MMLRSSFRTRGCAAFRNKLRRRFTVGTNKEAQRREALADRRACVCSIVRTVSCRQQERTGKLASDAPHVNRDAVVCALAAGRTSAHANPCPGGEIGRLCTVVAMVEAAMVRACVTSMRLTRVSVVRNADATCCGVLAAHGANELGMHDWTRGELGSAAACRHKNLSTMIARSSVCAPLLEPKADMTAAVFCMIRQAARGRLTRHVDDELARPLDHAHDGDVV